MIFPLLLYICSILIVHFGRELALTMWDSPPATNVFCCLLLQFFGKAIPPILMFWNGMENTYFGILDLVRPISILPHWPLPSANANDVIAAFKHGYGGVGRWHLPHPLLLSPKTDNPHWSGWWGLIKFGACDLGIICTGMGRIGWHLCFVKLKK